MQKTGIFEHTLEETIAVARGKKKADLVLRNARVVCVHSGEIESADVAIHGRLIVGLGSYEGSEIIDLDGKILCPGFTDSHVHLESSMVDPVEFARVVVPRGTTTVIADPHEIANVKGMDGINYILAANDLVPLDIFLMAPSCVPATHLETSGAQLPAGDLEPVLADERVLGLAELMNFPGVLIRAPDVLEKIRISSKKERIDGHCPGLTGKDLNAYLVAGALSDHECTKMEEAQEKLRRGMYIMIREGSVTRDLEALLPLVNWKNYRRCLLVTDDREPLDLLEEGHINFLLKKAIAGGLDPVQAIAMATLNPAEYFGLKRRGAVAPGHLADLVVLDNLKDFNVKMVLKRGKIAAKDGEPLFTSKKMDATAVLNTVRTRTLSLEDLRIPAQGIRILVIGIIPKQIVTRKLVFEPKVVDGLVVSDTERDILKLVVLERHGKSGGMGLGFVQGIGLKKGALATTIAHDSHNIIAVGVSDADILAAVESVVRMQGGLAVVSDGRIVGGLPLPIAGLMSDRPLVVVKSSLEEMENHAAKLGATAQHPFMTLSFLALPVIPELKITDKGLVDVSKFDFVDLFSG